MSVRHIFTVGIAVLVGLALVAGPAYAKKKDKTASTTSSQAVTLPEAAAKPKTAYEGILSKAGQTGRIKVAEDGRVITSLAWQSNTPEPQTKAKGGKKKKS
jgi:hypothetical protein